MTDYIEFDDGFAMIKTPAPTSILGRPLADTAIRSRFGVTVVAIKRPGEGFTYATADTILSAGDTIIVSGQVHDTERFADLT